MIKKAQASLEYMSIFALAAVLIVTVGGLFFAYTHSAKESLDRKQINKIGTELLTNIEKVYFFGDGNRVTMDINFPKGIESLQIYNINESGDNYFYFNISTISGGVVQNMIFETKEDYIKLNCKECVKTYPGTNTIFTYNQSYLFQGFKQLRIEAINDSVYTDFVFR